MTMGSERPVYKIYTYCPKCARCTPFELGGPSVDKGVFFIRPESIYFVCDHCSTVWCAEVSFTASEDGEDG